MKYLHLQPAKRQAVHGALAAALVAALIGCSGPIGPITPVADETQQPAATPQAAPAATPAPQPEEATPPPAELEPEPVKIRLHVSAGLRDQQVIARYLSSTNDSESEGSLVSSVANVPEGGYFRLMVRFDGTIPIRGTCTITLEDSGGHAMDDVTATANGFDASTDLINVVDDDEVTDDRRVTATLVSCDLPDIEDYEIAEPNTAVVLVRDHDPGPSDPTPPGGGTGGSAPEPEEPDAWTWTSATATLSAPSTYVREQGWLLTVNISPSLPELPDPNGSYSVEINLTFVAPDGTSDYGVIRQALNSGDTVRRFVWMRERWPDGTVIRASLDLFSELYPTVGVAQFYHANRYGTYSIGSPSSATATQVPE